MGYEHREDAVSGGESWQRQTHTHTHIHTHTHTHTHSVPRDTQGGYASGNDPMQS